MRENVDSWPTFWNGEPCSARRVVVKVLDDAFPMYWARLDGIIGEDIPAVEVTYAGRTFYLDDRDGSGWAKVTVGRGSPQYGHASIAATDVRPRIT